MHHLNLPYNIPLQKSGSPTRRAPHFYERKRRSFIYGTLRKGSLFLLESILTQSADGALEILGQILEGGAGGDAVFFCAHSGVIFKTANANVLFHIRNSFPCYLMFMRSCIFRTSL